MSTVDIVMATYNGEKYIREQIESILNQTYKDTRILIHDDGSSDHTIEIINELIHEYPLKIVLISDNIVCRSAEGNFMHAMKQSDAEYIMFSDQDDVWLPHKIQMCLTKMKEIENRIGKDKPILVFGSYQPVDEELKPLEGNRNNRQEAAYKTDFTNLLVQNYVNGCLSMINRSLANKMGDYDKAILMHDWWAALIAGGGGEIHHIDNIMMLYRQHHQNAVGAVNVKSIQYRIKKIRDKRTREAGQEYLKQAKLLYQRNKEGLTLQHREELKTFIDLYQKNKPGRIIGLIKGKYLKSDLVRILGQLWYI